MFPQGFGQHPSNNGGGSGVNNVAGTYNNNNSGNTIMPNLFSDMINMNRRMMMGGFSMPSVNFGMTVMGQSSIGGMPTSKSDGMNDVSGKWNDKSGMIWHITQNGNTFQMVEERTGFTGKGSVISKNMNGTEWIIHVSLTAQNLKVHNRLQAFDNNMLIGQRDFFKLTEKFNTNTKPSPTNFIDPNISLRVVGSLYKSKNDEWQVIMKQNDGLYTIKNRAGVMKNLCVTPDSNGQLMVFISQEGKSGKGEEAIYCETADIAHLSLSNGEVWTLEAPKVNMNTSYTPYQQPQNYYSQPSYPMYHQPPPQPTFYPQNNSFVSPSNNYPSSNPYPPHYGHHQPPPQHQQSYYPPNNTFVPPPQPIPTYVPPPRTIGWVESILACKNEGASSILEKIDQYSKSQYEQCESQHLKQILELFSHGTQRRDAISKLLKNLAIGYLTCSSVARDIIPLFNMFSQTLETITLLTPQITDRRQNAELICKSFNSFEATRIRDILMK